MAGIYLHIPYCKKACHYCNFHFSTSLKTKDEFERSLLKEIDLQRFYLEGAAIDTIYFGGGTPSLLSHVFLQEVLQTIVALHPVTKDAEITLETNPDDLTDENLQAWKSIGINRLSIGIQSFFQEDLAWMNRLHDATQAIEGLQKALRLFPNCTIDLIYGTPGLTDEKWAQNVQIALSMGVPHLSCYALTVEPNTALQHFIVKGKKEDVDQDQQARQFLLLQDWIVDAGYEAYEISNYAKPGLRSKHNSAYWQGKKYLGLGPSAHSFNGVSRQWNIAHNALYIQSIALDTVPFEVEHLTLTQQVNERIMTALRTAEGLPIAAIEDAFGTTYASPLQHKLQPFIEEGCMILENGSYILSKEGRLRADGIAAACFF